MSNRNTNLITIPKPLTIRERYLLLITNLTLTTKTIITSSYSLSKDTLSTINTARKMK